MKQTTERRRLTRDMKEQCVRIEEEHVCISKLHLPAQEQKMLVKLQYDIEVLCVWQWCLLSFAALTKLNEKIRSAGIEGQEEQNH